MIDWIQYPAACLAIVGAWLVADRVVPRRRVGFALWVASNGFLAAWAVAGHAWGLLAMYLAFTVTSARGWWLARTP